MLVTLADKLKINLTLLKPPDYTKGTLNVYGYDDSPQGQQMIKKLVSSLLRLKSQVQVHVKEQSICIL